MQAQLQLMHAGLPSVSLRAVQMAIDKGKGISHLYKGHKSVPLTNPVIRVESRVAQNKLASTLVLSGRYTLMQLFRMDVKYDRPSWPWHCVRSRHTRYSPFVSLQRWTGMSPMRTYDPRGRTSPA